MINRRYLPNKPNLLLSSARLFRRTKKITRKLVSDGNKKEVLLVSFNREFISVNDVKRLSIKNLALSTLIDRFIK